MKITTNTHTDTATTPYEGIIRKVSPVQRTSNQKDTHDFLDEEVFPLCEDEEYESFLAKLDAEIDDDIDYSGWEPYEGYITNPRLTQ